MLKVAGRRLTPSLSWRPTTTTAAARPRGPLARSTRRDDDDGCRRHVQPRFSIESPFFVAVRGFSTEILIPRNQDTGLAELPATIAALKNPNSKVVYDEYNHERHAPGDPSKRAFAYFVLSGGRFIYASLLRLLILKFVLSMSASKDVLALASLEVDLSSIEPGTTVTVKWHGKPVFIRRRTEDDIKLANSVDLG
ncbi:hypothetical protein ABZP36_003179 [Zizania latifolia]